MSEMVPEGWREQSIKELIGRDGLMTDGDWIESKDQDPNGEIKLIQLADIGDGFFIDKSSRFMTIQKSIDLKTTKLQKNDILVARMPEPIGRSCLFPRLKIESVTVVDIAIIRTTKSNPYWLMSLINNKNVRNEIALKASGSTRTRIARKELEQIKVKIPPLPEQEKIASILTSVDEVIEKTESQISKLQDLKKGMMQELLTKGIGHTEYKDSPVGRIPASWEVKTLQDICTLSRGKFSHRPRNDPQFYNGQYPFLQTGDIPTENPDIRSHSQTLNEKGLGVSKLFSSGTLVLTIAATVGEIGILTFDSCFPDSLVGLNVKVKLANAYFILYMMRYRKDDLIGLAPESAQKNLNLEILNPFEVVVPPLAEQQKIVDVLSSIDSKIEVKQQKREQTQNLKKSLMQDLLTGKVRVSVN